MVKLNPLLADKLDAVVYTDGSSGKYNHGGWAAIVATPYFGVELSGYSVETTNNRMELEAAIRGLSQLPGPHNVALISDSAYLLNTISNGWYERWFQEKYSTKWTSRPNIDLWYDIAKLLCYHTVTPIKVKGHSGHVHNERVDKLAVKARLDQEERFEVLYGNIEY